MCIRLFPDWPPQATCTHVRLLAVVGGNERIAEDAANELASVLQVCHSVVHHRRRVQRVQGKYSRFLSIAEVKFVAYCHTHQHVKGLALIRCHYATQ